ncbi:MAG TPA: DUF58 domain-containing protein, partial [Longimicrobiales bacterium]|nr:DUF58 domain-containing protein [Longimicrobiales bacterium]
MTVPVPTRRLLVLLAGASLLFLVDPALALAADAVLLAAAAVDGLATVGARRPRVVRSASPRVVRGGTGVVEVGVVNPGPRTLTVRVTDDLPRHLDRTGPQEARLAVPAGDEAVWAYEIRAAGRGTAPLGDVHLRIRGPLGLVWRPERVARADPLKVQPGVREMRRFRLLGLRERLRRTGLRNVRQRGEGRAFESLREYVRGDDPRAVDWKATARHGDLMVRQYEAERSQNVILAVDAGRVMLEPMGDRDRLDHALTAALLLTDVAGIHGDHVGLMVFADRVQRFLPPRRGSVARIADALATVESRSVEPNYPLAFSTLARQVGRRSLVVLFTDIIDAQASSALLTQLGRSAQRHLVLAVTLRNPELA